MKAGRRPGRRPKVFLGKYQREIAEALGVQQSTVSRWLSGITSPSAEDIKTISEITGMSQDEVTRKISSSALA